MKAIYIKASWCSPCKVQHPKFIAECERLGLEYITLDADEDETEVEKYNVRNVPFVIIERDGEIIAKGRAEDMTPRLQEYV